MKFSHSLRLPLALTLSELQSRLLVARSNNVVLYQDRKTKVRQ